MREVAGTAPADVVDGEGRGADPSRLIHASDARLTIRAGDLTVIHEPDPQARPRTGRPAAVGLGPEAALSATGWAPAWRWLATRPVRAVAKRSLDLIGASLLILLLLPVLIAVALAVKMTSPGPVLFTHTRLGRGGQPIRVCKFRTMVGDADERLADLLASDEALAAAFAADHKLKDDPRITPVGATLRRLSLDELPQLFNVLVGDMSLVGPRPIVGDEVGRYGAHMASVLRVRPGMTGVWQISGRNDLPYWRRVELDVRYAEEHALLGDLMILLWTVRAVLRGDRNGAY